MGNFWLMWPAGKFTTKPRLHKVIVIIWTWNTVRRWFFFTSLLWHLAHVKIYKSWLGGEIRKSDVIAHKGCCPSLWSNNVCILYGYERYWEQGYLVVALTFCLALNQVLLFSVPIGIQHQWVDTRVLSTLVLHCVFLKCDRNECLCNALWIYMIKAVPLGIAAYGWFSRYVIATMLVDKKKSSLISSFCSSTIGQQQTLDICSYHYLFGGTKKK